MSGYYPASVRGRLVFWQHERAQTIPTGVWTPLAFNNLIITRGDVDEWTTYSPATTAISAAENGLTLPKAQLRIDDPSNFAAFGAVVVEIGGTDRLVLYTGKQADRLTGCTLGVGTLVTGQTVRQANVTIDMPPNNRIGPAIAEVAFAANAAGDRGIRFLFLPGIPGGTKTERAANGVHHVQTAEQPANTPSDSGTRIEVFQDSGVSLDTVVQPISAPRLVVLDVSAYRST